MALSTVSSWGGGGGNPTADFIKNYGPSPEMISRIDYLILHRPQPSFVLLAKRMLSIPNAMTIFRLPQIRN